MLNTESIALIALLALPFLALPAVPHAAEPATLPLSAALLGDGDVDRAFAVLDANADGHIRFHEIGGAGIAIEARFELADSNHDGRLDRPEFEALMDHLSRRRVSALRR